MKQTRNYFDADRIDSGDDTVTCYPLRFHLQELRDDVVTFRRLYPAVMESGTGFFYCRHHGEVGETGQGCGVQCAAYAPRNGKNGRCRHSANCYDADTQNPVLLQRDGTLVPAAKGRGINAQLKNTPAIDFSALGKASDDMLRSVEELSNTIR
jgi:hypothetical protein